MIDFFQKYGRNYKYSQNSEEGVLEECLKRMGLRHGVAFEFGAANGQYCSNTALLIEQGWSGFFIEPDYELFKQCAGNWQHNPAVICQQAFVTPENINNLVGECDVLSIDCDGPDIELFRALKAKPKIVIIEIDSSIPPDRDECNSAGGAGYLPMLRLALEKSFFLVCHTGNLLLCANEYRHLFPEIIGDGISNCDLYFNRAWMG